MKNHCLSGLIIGVLFALSPGCEESGVSIDVPVPGLYAHVVDSLGNPLADVDVHYIFYTTTNPITLNTIIQYSIASPQVVTMKVLDPFGDEAATIIDAQSQVAGYYSINVGPRLTNGMYTCKLIAGASEQRFSFFFRTDDIAYLQQRPPLLRSDAKGDFYLSPSVLGIGRHFHVQNGYDEVVADSISIVVAKAGFQTLVRSVRIDTTQAVSKTLKMISD